MKAIPPENYQISPFVTHKQQAYNITFLSGSDPVQVTVDLAVIPPTGSVTWAWNGLGPEPMNVSGIPQRTLYVGVKHLFYDTGSIWNLDRTFIPTGSQFYVIGMPQKTIGEGIRPHSLQITATLSSASLFDDGNGNIVSSVAPSASVGNVFYSLGIAVIQQDVSPVSASVLTNNGLYLTTGSALHVTFDATQTIYEHRIVCTMDIGESNYSLNPSVSQTGSLGGAGKILDQFASGSLTPYMTTVGIYNDAGELVATGKFPRPLKRATESQQTVVIRFDA
jgi:hypothetical protein